MKISLAAKTPIVNTNKIFFSDTELYMIGIKIYTIDLCMYVYIYKKCITAVIVRSHRYACRLKARGRLGREKKSATYTRLTRKKLEAAACGQITSID